MTETCIPVRIRKTEISAVVTRADGTIEDLGVISLWHSNPLIRWAYKLRRLAKWLPFNS